MKRCILKSNGALVVIAVLMVFLFTSASGAADKPKEIILGGITALSGPAAPWGQVGMPPYLTWIDLFNKEGFKVNGKTYNFKLIIAKTLCNKRTYFRSSYIDRNNDIM